MSVLSLEECGGIRKPNFRLYTPKLNMLNIALNCTAQAHNPKEPQKIPNLALTFLNCRRNEMFRNNFEDLTMNQATRLLLLVSTKFSI